MKKGFLLIVFSFTIKLISGCGIDLPDMPIDLGNNDEIIDGIEHEMTINYDDYSFKTYSSTLAYDATMEEFENHLKDQGYTQSDAYEEIEAFFMQEDMVSHGGIVYEDDDDYKYLYMTGSDGDVTIYTMIADKARVEDYDTDNDDHGTDDEDNDHDDSDDPLVVPEDDVEGEDVTILKRYPNAVRIEHTMVQDQEGEHIVNEYLVEDSIQEVYNFFLDELDDEHWTITSQQFSASEGLAEIKAYYGDTFGVTIGVEAIDDIVRIWVYSTEYD